jgi:hypothetical protein
MDDALCDNRKSISSPCKRRQGAHDAFLTSSEAAVLNSAAASSTSSPRGTRKGRSRYVCGWYESKCKHRFKEMHDWRWVVFEKWRCRMWEVSDLKVILYLEGKNLIFAIFVTPADETTFKFFHQSTWLPISLISLFLVTPGTYQNLSPWRNLNTASKNK